MFRLVWCASVLLCLAGKTWALDANGSVQSTPLLRTTQSWDGKPIVYPQGKAEVSGLLVEIAPGGETGWHTHAAPSFAYMLQGSLEVRLQDGRIKKLQAGDVLAEVVDTPHNGRNIGTVPVRLVVFYTGREGQKLSAPISP